MIPHLGAILVAGVVAMAAAAVALVPGSSQPVSRPTAFAAHLETRTLGEFSQANALHGRLAIERTHSYDGHTAVRADYCGDTANGFARGVVNVDWPAGGDVWYGAAMLLPPGFLRDVQGEVDLLRWDDWPQARQQARNGGVVIFASDKRAHLVQGTYSGEEDTLGRSFALPQGRWFWLEVHQTISDEASLSEVYLDGRRVLQATSVQGVSSRVSRLRVGIVSMADGLQRRPLHLWFDRVLIGSSQAGPGRGTTAHRTTLGHRAHRTPSAVGIRCAA